MSVIEGFMDRSPLNTSHITIDRSFKSSLFVASGTFQGGGFPRKCCLNISGVVGTLKCEVITVKVNSC